MREDNKFSVVSIITVCLNSEKTIRNTIESVLRQTYNALEYILIDGHSTDNTMDIIQSYEQKFRDRNITYRYISEKDEGIYDAMNKGIFMASGELIGIINSDDCYEPTAAETAMTYYKKENYDIFYADICIINHSKKIIKKSKKSRWITSRYWNHPTTFIPKRIYDYYQYKNENIHDDWDLILRIRKNIPDCKICVINKVLANFRLNGVSHQKGVRNAWKRAKIKYNIYRDNGYSRWYVLECYGMEILKMLL